MNNAAITLKCPSCQGVFLTLQQSVSNLETCPHCAVAAPRVQFLPVDGIPQQSGKRTALPAKRQEEFVQPEHAPPSAPQTNPFAQPPIQVPAAVTGPPAHFGWPPANNQPALTAPAQAPVHQQPAAQPFTVPADPVTPPQLPPSLTTLYPPAPAVEQPAFSAAPSTQPAVPTFNPFSSPASSTSSTQIPPYSAEASVPTAQPLFAPSNAHFPPAPSKAQEEPPQLFKTNPTGSVHTEPAAPAAPFFSQTPPPAGLPGSPFFQPASTEANQTSPFGSSEQPNAFTGVSFEHKGAFTPPLSPPSESNSFVVTNSENQSEQPFGFSGFPTAPISGTPQGGSNFTPPAEAQVPPSPQTGFSASPFFQPSATPPHAATATGPANIQAPPTTGTVFPPPNPNPPAWPGLGVNENGLGGASAKGATPNKNIGSTGKTPPRPSRLPATGSYTTRSYGSVSAIIRKLAYLFILSALSGGAIWYFRGQPKSVGVPPSVTIVPTIEDHSSAPMAKPEQVVNTATEETSPPAPSPDISQSPIPKAEPAPEMGTPPASASPLPPPPQPQQEETRRAVPLMPSPDGANAPNNSPASTEAATPTASTPEASPQVTNEMLLEVRRTLNALFDPATDTATKMQRIAEPQKLYDAVDKFFTSGVTFDEKSLRATNHQITVLPSGEETFIYHVMTDASKGGSLIRLRPRFGQPPELDWNLFYQSHEELFDTFSAPESMNGKTEPVWFGLLCKRAHDFALSADQREKYLALEAQGGARTPNDRRVYVHLDSTAGRYLNKQIEWEKIYLVQVLLDRTTIDGKPALVILDCKMSK